MKDLLYIDSETRSPIPIKYGIGRYMERAEVMLVSYAINDEEPEPTWDLMRRQRMPKRLWEAVNECILVAHNSWFDRNLFEHCQIFPGVDLSPQRWVDTMVQAYCHGLPGKLDSLCTVYNIAEEQAKSKSGKQLIHLFCKPRKDGKYNDETTHPAEWAEFRDDYAPRDIKSMRVLHRMIPKWNYPGVEYRKGVFAPQHANWVNDQRMNQRGICLDLELIKHAIEAEKIDREQLNVETARATDGEVQAATQRDEMLRYILQAHGVPFTDLRADTIKRAIEDPDLPDAVKELLELRAASARNSSKKYKAAADAASADGRVRGTIQFSGAQTTGRMAARLLQPQNMMRPTMKQWEIEQAIADIKTGAAPYVYTNTAEVLGNCVRGMLIAAPGRKLCAVDLSSIEGRGLAWLAREEPVVEFFHQVDRKEVDYDSYMLTYASVFGGDPAEVTKEERQHGKPIDLSMGYGGGVAAYLTFAAVYRINLEKMANKVWEIADRDLLHECERKYPWAKKHRYHAGLDQHMYAAFEYVKQKWRNARPLTVQLWSDLEDAFRNATLTPDVTFTVGAIKFNRNGQWLRIRLPSGRMLCFLQPRFSDNKLTFLGLNRYTRKWGRVGIYGGKLAGLVTQAFACDVMVDAIPDLEDMGYPIVLSVHDELITEPLEHMPLQPMIDRMIAPRAWAPGLPLNAGGFEALRYRKD
jgi:DNA polymerase